ncbi:MAG: sulfatase-like hydrolase/transferase, partial [Geodermatophilaceae bacterium]|nr:sulfatase-like hydrolase/transferase [Geodermatophilaceae bacterium]
MPRDPSFDEVDVSDKPAEVSDREPLSQTDIDYLTTLNRQRLETLLAVDEAVVELMDVLEATGEAGNTLIVFTSDNGFLLGEHRIPGGKG